MCNHRHIFYAVIAVMTGCTLLTTVFNIDSQSIASNPNDTAKTKSSVTHSGKRVVHLYFSDRETALLKSEERMLNHPDDPAELGRNIINALIQGPQGDLVRTIPEGTALRAFYVTQAGIAYVDITGAVRTGHPGGIESERITIYSIVNSLILNVSEINAVKILIDGNESMTLAGHIDLRFPFKANMLLIR